MLSDCWMADWLLSYWLLTGTTITETETGLETGRGGETAAVIVTVVVAETRRETAAVIVIMSGIALVIENENVTQIMTVLAMKGTMDRHMREMVAMTRLSQCTIENGPAPNIEILSLVSMNTEENGLMNLSSMAMAMSMIVIIMGSSMITSSHMLAGLSMKSRG